MKLHACELKTEYMYCPIGLDTSFHALVGF